ncbi:MAG: hypothetical protein DWQ07_01420 [Chloroflexi bacterium]|nr:MAG: hypothetical protein DWQ07_01420 [Chloroflexota bacterium]MBL1193844.1 hypothetical protein [Chloroflexota bacterium]NOH11138.1 hypothetical protein [Chloroflexota bacterium]
MYKNDNQQSPIEDVLTRVRFVPDPDLQEHLREKLFHKDQMHSPIQNNVATLVPVPRRRFLVTIMGINQHFAPKRWMLIAVLMAALLVALFSCAPSIRETLSNWMQHFGFVLVEPDHLQNAQPVHVEIENMEEPISLSMAQEIVPYSIPLPAWVPDDLTFLGVLVSGEISEVPHPAGEETPVVSLLYGKNQVASSNAPAQLVIVVAPESEYVGALVDEAAIETVLIGDNEALFVKGTWQTNEASSGLQWDPTVDVVRITWETNGFTYELTAHDLDLNMEDVIKIAESVSLQSNDPYEE